MKILILCTGNSCRSQMAQGFLQSFNQGIQVCSAGTEPAREVNRHAVSVMYEVGVDISHQVPISVVEYLDNEWDYVITVCGGAKENCPAFVGQVRERLHIGFDDPAEVTGTEDFVLSEFRRIRDEIRAGFLKFYHENIENH